MGYVGILLGTMVRTCRQVNIETRTFSTKCRPKHQRHVHYWCPADKTTGLRDETTGAKLRIVSYREPT